MLIGIVLCFENSSRTVITAHSGNDPRPGGESRFQDSIRLQADLLRQAFLFPLTMLGITCERVFRLLASKTDLGRTQTYR